MRKFCDHLTSFYKKTVFFFMRMMLVFLFVTAMVSTSALKSDISEETLFVGDNVFNNLIIVVGGTILLGILYQKGYLKVFLDKLYSPYLILAIFAISLSWIIMSRYTPRSDQMSVFAVIQEIHVGDFHKFDYGEYFSKFPYQVGIVAIYYVWAMIFGYKSEIGLQFLNVLALVYFYKKFSDVNIHTGLGEKYKKAIYILGILFYPLAMYCSFIYGNILGLAFSVAAIDFELTFFKDGKKWHAVMSVILIFLGITAKKNYVIFAIAMLIYAIFEIMKSIKVQNLLYAFLIITVILTNSVFLDTLSFWLTGEQNNAGMTSWSYVAMGLMDGPRAYGWHNNFEEYSYEKSEFDPERQKEMALETIKGELGHFYHDPNYAKEFFILKLASQWNNPTFECHWINQICDHDGIHSELVETINSDGASGVIYRYLDFFMLLVLLGAISAFWLKNSNDYSNAQLIFATIFIGGFLFHIVWEAKGQYTLSYFVLLFPYVTVGYKTLIERIMEIYIGISSHRGLAFDIKKVFVFVACFLFILLIIGGDFRQLTEDTYRWNMYLDGIMEE